MASTHTVPKFLMFHLPAFTKHPQSVLQVARDLKNLQSNRTYFLTEPVLAVA